MRALELLKTTALGGSLFLIPVVIVAAIIGKALQLMKLVAAPLQRWFPIESPRDVLLADLLLVLAILLLCLLAGLAAKSPPARRFRAKLEALLTTAIPGYSIVKGFTTSLRSGEEAASGFRPVLARFDDNAQLAFKVGETASGEVTVYLPGAPNPWSGTVIQMDASRIEPVDMTATEALKSLQRMGAAPATPPTNE